MQIFILKSTNQFNTIYKEQQQQQLCGEIIFFTNKWTPKVSEQSQGIDFKLTIKTCTAYHKTLNKVNSEL